MTREEFEARRAEGLARAQEVQENSKNNAAELEGRSGILAKIAYFLAYGAAKAADKMERQLKNAKYK